MVQKSLVNYVRDLLQKGYDSASIRNVLLKYGYTDKDVSDAISSTYHTTIRHEIHLSRATIFVILFVFASLIGAGSFFYYSSKAPKQLLDLNLEPVATRIAAGENAVFLKELSNLGYSKRYDVVVRQEVIDKKTSRVVTEKTETRAIETFGATRTEIQIPGDAEAGDYILRVIVEYDDKKAVATLPITVTAFAKREKEKESCTDWIQNQNEEGIDCGGACKPCKAIALDCNDNNTCTEDFIKDGSCVNNPIADCQKGLEEPSPATQTIDDIKELAKLNPAKALQQCSQVEVPDIKDACISNIAEVQKNKNYCKMVFNARLKDLCYSNIAKSLNDNSVCEEISIESRKDSCYMTFVLDNKDYSVCNKLVNSNLRQSCESLRQLRELSQQQNI